ncbi:MAG: segregation/condensation protein A [Verrucomicrobiia bacterium]
MGSEYKVRLEVFEGPLDLLLYLVRRSEVDIYDISLEKITSQYLAYLEAAASLDLELAGDFFVTASTLIYIKSRELLPVDQQPPPSGEDEDEQDPRWELIRQLIEYKKFKEAAAELQAREGERERMFPRRPPTPLHAEAKPPLEPLSLAELLKAFNQVLKRLRNAAEITEVYDEHHTVGDKMVAILKMLERRRVIEFTELFHPNCSRIEMVVTFLALLELVRMKQLFAEQLSPLGQIVLRGNPQAVGFDPSFEERGMEDHAPISGPNTRLEQAELFGEVMAD